MPVGQENAVNNAGVSKLSEPTNGDTTSLDLTKEVKIQREYYARTARNYNAMHCHENDQHYFALDILLSLLDRFGVHSILDLGSGTGRSLLYMIKHRPDLRLIGIEPSAAMRTVAYESGVPKHVLLAGDATALPFPDRTFDLVCAFGVLHHIKYPSVAVREALRVARKGVFISDANNFGQGSLLVRLAKQTLKACGLWPLANTVKTMGRGYSITDGDGLAYSYSLFSNLRQIRQECRSLYLFGTEGSGANLYRSASCVAVLGVKGLSNKTANHDC